MKGILLKFDFLLVVKHKHCNISKLSSTCQNPIFTTYKWYDHPLKLKLNLVSR